MPSSSMESIGSGPLSRNTTKTAESSNSPWCLVEQDVEGVLYTGGLQGAADTRTVGQQGARGVRRCERVGAALLQCDMLLYAGSGFLLDLYLDLSWIKRGA